LFFVVGVIVTGVTKTNSCIVPSIQLDKSAWQLYLNNRGIQTICSEAFFGFEQLRRLHFEHNQLTVLSKDLFKPLRKIEEIYLSGNKLTSISFDDFAFNQKLKVLYLTSNRIETIEPINFGGEFSITKLWLNFNKLVNMTELCKLAKLEELSLGSNKNLDYGTFKPSCWSELRHLNLEDTDLKTLNHDYRIFTGLMKLEHLFFGYNNLEVFCVANFPVLPALKGLDIKQSGLESLDANVLSMKFPNLKNIYLSLSSWNCDYFKSLESDLKIIGIAILPTYGENCVDGKTIPTTTPNQDAYKYIENQLTTAELPSATISKPTENTSTSTTTKPIESTEGTSTTTTEINEKTSTTTLTPSKYTGTTLIEKFENTSITTAKPSKNPPFKNFELQNNFLELSFYFACQIGLTVVLFLVDNFLAIYFFRI
jgi:Leucine rich repeat